MQMPTHNNNSAATKQPSSRYNQKSKSCWKCKWAHGHTVGDTRGASKHVIFEYWANIRTVVINEVTKWILYKM